MKKSLKVFWGVLQGVIIFYVIIITSLLFFSNKYGYTELGSYTLDTTKEGDLLFIKKDKNIKKDEEIYYYSTSNGKYVITSDKVVEIKEEDKKKEYVVGTINVNSVVKENKVVGTKVASYKHIGKFLDSVESRAGFLVFVLFPILIVFISQVYQFIMSMHFEK